MSHHQNFSFAPAHLVHAMAESMTCASRAGVLFQTADDHEYDGRRFQLHGSCLLNFSCCSYLGLELRRELKQGAISALNRYGTQFPFPRAMLQAPLYEELCGLLEQITEGRVVIAASTSLAHIAGIPVLVGPNDAVILDMFAHASLHTAVALLRNSSIELLRHSRMDLLEERIRELSLDHDRVWYLADGLYSILGDFAPLEQLVALRDRFPRLWLYIDDAHCTSWAGRFGRGRALDTISDRARVVVALSLNKAFAAGGGALVLPSEELATQIGYAGGPMVFSGAIQPPLLGAAVASAQLHISAEFATLQRELESRLKFAISLAGELQVPLANTSVSPVFFIRCGSTDRCFSLVEMLKARGIGVCAAVFPIVPRNQAGIRFTITLHNTLQDIEMLMESLKATTSVLGVSLVRSTARQAANAPSDDAPSAEDFECTDSVAKSAE